MALGGPPDKKDGNFWTWRMKSEVEPTSGPVIYRPAVTVEVQDEVVTGYTFDGNNWIRYTWNTQQW